MHDSVDRAQVTVWSLGVEHIGEAVCAIGAFDGFHRGHRYLVESMAAAARKAGLPSVVVTFDVDPLEVLCPDRDPRKLLPDADRIELIARSGVDHVLVVPFDRELASLPYDEFLVDVLGRFMTLRGIHVGRDFRLGRGAAGDVTALAEWGGANGCEVRGYDLLEVEHGVVSASRIRDLLAAGEATMAAELLGRPFYVRGEVVLGRQEGRKLGFPTANVRTPAPFTQLADGVYAGYCAIDGTCLPAAINVGYPPTFEGAGNLCKLEPHIIGFDGDLYGTQLCVSFVRHLRGMVKFDSLDDLIATVQGNIAWTRENLPPVPADPLGFALR